MVFSKPKSPRKPSPPPRLVDIELGSVAEKQRRKKARGSSTLLSRGMFKGDPLILYPELGGLKTKLGE